MKLLKRILAAVMAVALVAFVPSFNAATAKADSAKTYSIKFVPSLNEWRVQMLPQWDDGEQNGALSFLYTYLNDGDSIVIWGGTPGSTDLSNLQLDKEVKNLTIFGVTNCCAIIYSNKNIKDVVVVQGSVASLHGKIENVHVYDDCSVNVNDDVKFLHIARESKMEMNVTALGTVEHCQVDSRGNILKDMYNVKAGALKFVKGEDKTDAAAYSTTSTGTPASSGSASASTGSTTTNSGASVSPKTSDNGYAILLLAGACICMAGAYLTKKRFA